MARRRNPTFAKDGLERVYIPLRSMTNEEIVALPRAAYEDEDEWNQLTEEQQQAIYEGHEEDLARAMRLAEILGDEYRWHTSPAAFDDATEMEHFEQWLNMLVRDRSILNKVERGVAAQLVDAYVAGGASADEVRDAIEEVVSNQNSWDVGIDDGGGDYSHQLDAHIHLERTQVLEDLAYSAFHGKKDYQQRMDSAQKRAKRMAEVRGRHRKRARGEPQVLGSSGWPQVKSDWPIFESDVGIALELLRHRRVGNGRWTDPAAARLFDDHRDGVWDLIAPDGDRWATLEIGDIPTDLYFSANVDWTTVWDEVEEAIGPPSEPEVEEPGEERRIMELPDGFYVAELAPGDLALEGKTQGICVGKPQYGYANAVRAGDTMVLSLRRPSGKPLLTFEVEMAHPDRNGVRLPVDVIQIKGKGNRLPGWARGATGEDKVKEHEVKLAIKVVEQLGLDPDEVGDLEPALRAMREPRSNPARRGRAYHPAKTFSDPVGR